jgi:spore coat protein H
MLPITFGGAFPARTLAVACALGIGLAVALDPPGTAAQQSRPAGWADSTHGEKVRPDYDRLFSMDRVHELRITIPAESFRAMQEDLRAITPGFGARGRGFGPPGGGADPFAAFMEAGTAACSERQAGAACTVNGQDGQCNAMPAGPLVCMPPAVAGLAGPGRMGRGGAPQLISRDPIYVPVTVEHDGRTWTHVGMRYKGNSSLASANMSSNGKIPFRLDFDRYEDDAPETRNQRFYGFQKMTFASNFGDDSQLREVFATEVLRDRGIPAARAAFYRIYVDTGSGPEYWGLYTMVEDPADGAMLDAQFGSRSGNLYKPEGAGANWSEFNAAGFNKKTNERAADYTDVRAAIAALHAPQTSAAAWRDGLEAVFDVDHFLRWLAVNTAMQNWDAYGVMAHNYYLYGDPAQKGRLRWVPWDHNFSLGAAPNFGGGPGGVPGGPPPGAPFPPGVGFGAPRGAGPGGAFPGPIGRGGFPGGMFGGNTDVLHSQVGEEWPLIRKLLADDVYAARYRVHLEHALGGLYSLEAAHTRLRELHALIAPAVVGADGERPTHTTIGSAEAFENAIDGVMTVVRQRHEAIREALKGANAR